MLHKVQAVSFALWAYSPEEHEMVKFVSVCAGMILVFNIFFKNIFFLVFKQRKIKLVEKLTILVLMKDIVLAFDMVPT